VIAPTVPPVRADAVGLVLGLLFALMWSSAFASARIIVAEAPPILSLALRFAISGALGVAIALAFGQRARLTRGQWRAVVVFGLCQNALYLGLNFVAMQTVEASLAAIVASSLPLWVALANWTLFGDRTRPLGVAGLIAGSAGVLLIMGTRLQGGADPMGVLLCVGGVLALTVATLSVRGASGGGNLMMVVGLQMLVGAAALLPAGLALETWDVTWSPRLIAALAYTTLVPGLLATWVWFLLVARMGATPAATFHFLNPVFGVAVAWALLGERLGPLDAVGVLVVTAGILAVQVSRLRAARSVAPWGGTASPRPAGARAAPALPDPLPLRGEGPVREPAPSCRRCPCHGGDSPSRGGPGACGCRAGVARRVRRSARAAPWSGPPARSSSAPAASRPSG
jgi:drug/metabolite transporter (DMT)-like permease